MQPRTPAVLVLAVALAAACGSGGSKAAVAKSRGVPTTPAPAATTSPTTGPQSVAADKVSATAALLKLADFPSGWTGEDHTIDPTEAALNARMSTCLGESVVMFQTDAPASADSQDFSDSDGHDVSETVTYASSTAKLRQDFALLHGQKVTTCLEQVMTAAVRDELAHPSDPTDTVPKGTSIGQPTVSPMSFPALGDQSVAFRVTLPVMYQSVRVEFHEDLVAAQVSRAAVMLTFGSSGRAFDTVLEERLSTLAVGRVAGKPLVAPGQI